MFQLFGGLVIQEIQNQIDSKHDLLYVPVAENLSDLGSRFFQDPTVDMKKPREGGLLNKTRST